MKQTFRNPLLYKLKVYLKNNKEFGKEVGSWVEKLLSAVIVFQTYVK